MCLKLMGDEKTILPTDGGLKTLLREDPVPRLCKDKETSGFPQQLGKEGSLMNTGVTFSLALLIMHAQTPLDGATDM